MCGLCLGGVLSATDWRLDDWAVWLDRRGRLHKGGLSVALFCGFAFLLDLDEARGAVSA